MDSAAQPAIVLRVEVSLSSRFFRLSEIQSLTVDVTVRDGCRFAGTGTWSSIVVFRLMILSTMF